MANPKIMIPVGNGQMIEAEILQFQEREPGVWLEFYLPDEKKWLRVKPTLIRVMKTAEPSRTGEPFSYRIMTENVIDVIPEVEESGA